MSKAYGVEPYDSFLVWYDDCRIATYIPLIGAVVPKAYLVEIVIILQGVLLRQINQLPELHYGTL